MAGIPTTGKSFRWLDFDIENRPLSYWIPDRPTSEVTAIAAGFVDRPKSEIAVWLLGLDEAAEMLTEFVAMYDEADGVTGHYILNHDLPILNAALVELGMKPLSQKLVLDTKVHLLNWKDIPKSQEHLAEMLGLPAPKVLMSQAKWREANRLTSKGLELTYKRVFGDVVQHQQLRKELMRLGLLGRPTVWRP